MYLSIFFSFPVVNYTYTYKYVRTVSYRSGDDRPGLDYQIPYSAFFFFFLLHTFYTANQEIN